MADDKNRINPEEPANDNNEQQQPGNEAEKSKPAANNADYAKYRQTAREYKQAKQKQEKLEEHIKQYAQEEQENIDKHIIDSSALDIDIETGAILVNNECPPQLNPDSPQFDPALYNKYAAAANEQIKANMEKLHEAVEQAASDIMNTEQMQDLLKKFSEVVAPAIESVKQMAANVVNSDLFKGFNDSLKYLTEHSEEIKQRLQEWEALQPYLEEELKKPEYGGKTIHDLLEQDYKDENGNIINDSLLEKAVEAARAAMITKKLPQIQYNDTDRIKTSTDKFSNLFFSLYAPQPKGMIEGQRSFIPVRYESEGAKKDITLFYDYTFNEAIIHKYDLSKQFTDEAFFVASIIDNLYDEGNTTVSLTKMWHEMGNSGSPSTDALTELNKILQLGLSTIIEADISEVQTGWGLTDKKTTKNLISPVMPIQILEEKFNANGKTANAIINITGHTPFYLVGYPIDHYTTWSKDILRLYKGRRTARYYSVLRYLISNIGWLRNPKSKRSNKLTYKDLYEKTGAKTTRAQQLTKEMLYRLIDEVFIPTGYVKTRVEDTQNEPGVKIQVTKNPQAKLPNKKKKQ